MYSAKVHCEAVLASLLKYPTCGGDEIRKHFEVWSPVVIVRVFVNLT